tara:strand:+ start:2184 stop:2828 length:645 start_codon:yes stop_codon:yes gene_type:complete
MIRTKAFKAIELLLLFVLIPLSYVLNYPLILKAAFAIGGFVYILWILKKDENISFKIASNVNWKVFWERLLVTFLAVILLTTLYVFTQEPANLFFVPFNKPGLYSAILVIYTFFSVWPQEIIYRTFFLNRYRELFRSKSLLIFINALVFSLAHFFFRNTLVLVLTFLGGIIFALTYLKFKSTTLVCIEHAVYGNWLFTVGMGGMLGFPGMDASV